MSLNCSELFIIATTLAGVTSEVLVSGKSVITSCWNIYPNATGAVFKVVIDVRGLGFDHVFNG
jgi:hypothetical protein